MQKKLRFNLWLLIGLMLMTARGAFADEVTWTAADQGYENAQAITSVVIDDNISVVFDEGTGSNVPKYYTSGTAVRAYGGNTITFTASNDATIKSIVFSFASGEGTNGITANVGTYTKATNTWEGESESVQFTIGGTSGHRRIATITVTYDLPAPALITDWWKASSSTPVTAWAQLLGNSLATIYTVYATTLKSGSLTIGGESFTHYIQLRNNADPSNEEIYGTEQSGSTPIYISATKECNVVFYFRRQKGSNGYDANDNKDLLCKDLDDLSTLLNGTEVLNSGADATADYNFVYKTYSLSEGHNYIFYRRGSTINLYGIKVTNDIPAPPTTYTVTFAAEGAQGMVPAAVADVEAGANITLPVNHTLYVEGKTLTGWNDGTTTYLPGADFTVPEGDVTLNAVFSDNTVSLADRTEAITLTWDFQTKNGAPVVAWENSGVKYWIAQATIGGETIDVPMTINTDGGKVAVCEVSVAAVYVPVESVKVIT